MSKTNKRLKAAGLALLVLCLLPLSMAWGQNASQTDAPADAPEVTAKVEEAPPAPTPTEELPREKQPVRVTSDRMVYDEKSGTVSFQDNVKATHAGLVLTADKVTAYFATGKKGKGVEQIDRIVATGSVRAVRGTTVGTCSTLTYTVADGILRMEGNPVLQDGPNTVTGKVIKFYLKDNRSEVIGGNGGQVEAVFTLPEGEEAP